MSIKKIELKGKVSAKDRVKAQTWFKNVRIR